jgi:glycerol kinase
VTGDRAVSDPGSGLLPTVAWQFAGHPPVYAVDGGVYNAGSAVNWLRQLGLFSDYQEIDSYEGISAIERGVVFVPALSGLACPYWDRSAAGLWLGLGLETDRADLCRALLEGIALRTAQVFRAMAAHIPLQGAVSIDGGLSRNSYFCEFLAGALGRELRVSANADLTGYGTARLACAAVGLPVDADAAPDHARRYSTGPLGEQIHKRFGNAVARCRGWR